jgi:replicative DNA helicase
MANKTDNVLTPEFLMDLFATCMDNNYMLGVIVSDLKKEHLPDKEFQAIHSNLCKYYTSYRKAPSFGILKQMTSGDRASVNLLEDINTSGSIMDVNASLEMLENYIRQVEFQNMYRDAGQMFNRQERQEAMDRMHRYIQWSDAFNLKSSEFVDVIATFGDRFQENRIKHNSATRLAPITRFYISDLDTANNDRDLRTQLTCILASTGVGKSHAARWIGKNACQLDGLNVLHFQLEGSEEEVINAYSASLVSCNTFRYETGTLRDVDVEKMEAMLRSTNGKLYVKSYPKFNTKVSTIDIKNSITKFRKIYGINPDVVIIDSMDLLSDASGKKWSENGTRHQRIMVANDLKDLASEEKVWMVATYQATIENREWLNDEKNVLTEYNCAEAKGLSRPLTHLITLNQSDHERKERVMRINVAKSRFFEKIEPFKIATAYDTEQFYDSVRTLNLNKTRP